VSKTFIFGAGASCHTGLPLVSNFLESVFHNNLENNSLRAVLDYMGRSKALGTLLSLDPDLLNIEDIFSFVDRNIDRRIPVIYDDLGSEMCVYEDLIEVIEKTIRFYFNENEELYPSFLNLISSEDRLISFNYDIFLDLAIFKKYGGINYGVPVRWVAEDLNVGEDSITPQFNKKGVPELLKPHGSLNFKVKGLEENIFIDDRVFFNKSTTYFPLDYENYPRTFLIPPSRKKNNPFTPLDQIWGKCLKRIKNSSQLVLIGYSMPPSDQEMISSFRRTIRHSKTLEKIVVINPNREEIIKNYSGVFESFEIIPLTFKEYLRILS